MEETTGKKVQMSFCQKAKYAITHITLEPLVMCYIFPSVMCNLAMQNLNLEKACRVDLALNESVCDELMSHNKSSDIFEVEVKVQKLVATVLALKNFLQSLLPCLILLFLGSWSDRHRRRLPCIFLPLTGEWIAIVGFIACTYFFYELPVVVNVITEAVPPGLVGGWFAMSLGYNSYMSDITTPEDRTVRMGLLNLINTISIPLGIAASGVLLKKIGFFGVFSIGLGMVTSGLVYGCCRVKEVPRIPVGMADKENEKETDDEENKITKKSFLADFFDISQPVKAFKVAFKKGENNRRMKVIACMLVGMLSVGPVHGEMAVLYLFVRNKFSWNEQHFGFYLALHFVSQIIGTGFMIFVLSRKYQVHDSIIGLMAAVAKIAASLWFALAPTGNMFLIGALLECIHSTAFIAVRSMLSKMIPSDELGKVYAIYGFAEALMPLFYGPSYTLLYKATIQTYPSLFFFIAAVLTIPCVCLFIWLYCQHRKELKVTAMDTKKDIIEKEQETLLQNHKI